MVSRVAVGALIGLLIGVAAGYQLWGPEPPVIETPASEVRQPDGSVVLERRPDPRARPAHEIPRGAVVERVATVTVQPTGSAYQLEARPPSVDNAQPGKQVPPESPPCTCAPVHVDLSLVRLGDGSRRVIASARGGTVVGGVDVPVESAAPRRIHRWAVGATRDLRGVWGVAVDRDLDGIGFLRIPVRLGVSVTPGVETRGELRVLLRF